LRYTNAVLEANAKVNGIGEIHTHPTPVEQFGCHFKYVTLPNQRVDVQNSI